MDEGAQPMLRSRLTQLDKETAELQPKLDDARSKWEANPQSTVAEEIYKDLKKMVEKLLDERRALVDKLPGGAGPGPSSQAAAAAAAAASLAGSARDLLALPVPQLHKLPSSSRTGVYPLPETVLPWPGVRQEVLKWWLSLTDFAAPCGTPSTLFALPVASETDVVAALMYFVLAPVSVCADELGKSRWPISQPHTWISSPSSSSLASKQQKQGQDKEKGDGPRALPRSKPDLQLIVGIDRTAKIAPGQPEMRSFLEVKHPDVLSCAGVKSLAFTFGEPGCKNVDSVLGQAAMYAQQHHVRFFAISTYEVTWPACIDEDGVMHVSEGFAWNDDGVTSKQVLLWLMEQALADGEQPTPAPPGAPPPPRAASLTIADKQVASSPVCAPAQPHGDPTTTRAKSGSGSSSSSITDGSAHPLSRLRLDARHALGAGLTGFVLAGSLDGQDVAVKQGYGSAYRHVENEGLMYATALLHLQESVVPKVLYCGPSLEGDSYVLVTSRVWGRTLTRYDGCLLPQALHALQAVHAAGVLHGDVRLENFMVTCGPKGGKPQQVVVLDFGHARLCSSREETLEEEEELRSLLPNPFLLLGSVHRRGGDLPSAGEQHELPGQGASVLPGQWGQAASWALGKGDREVTEMAAASGLLPVPTALGADGWGEDAASQGQPAGGVGCSTSGALPRPPPGEVQEPPSGSCASSAGVSSSRPLALPPPRTSHVTGTQLPAPPPLPRCGPRHASLAPNLAAGYSAAARKAMHRAACGVLLRL